MRGGPGEVQQFPDDQPAALGLADDDLDVLAALRVLLQALFQQRGVGEDAGQGVVDLVRHPGREPAHRGQLVGLGELALGLVDALDHAVEGPGQVPQFAPVGGLDGGGEIALGHPAGARQQGGDGTQHQAAVEPPDHQAAGEDRQQRQHHHVGAVVGDAAVRRRHGHLHVQDAEHLLLGVVGMAVGGGAGGLVGDGIDDAQHPGAPGPPEDPAALVHIQLHQRLALGVAGVAGLAPLVQDRADLLPRGGEHDRPLLVEQADLLDAFLLELADVADLAVQVVPAVLEHVVVRAALDGLAQLVGRAGEFEFQLGGVRPHDQGGHDPDGQGRREPGSKNQTCPDAAMH